MICLCFWNAQALLDLFRVPQPFPKVRGVKNSTKTQSGQASRYELKIKHKRSKAQNGSIYAHKYTIAEKEMRKLLQLMTAGATFLFTRLNHYALCLSYYSNAELFCLHVFRQAGPPRRVNRLDPRWKCGFKYLISDIPI